jgi:hypothetical protein
MTSTINCTQLTEAGILRWQLHVPNVLKLVVAPTALWDLHQLVKWRYRALMVRGPHSCYIYDRQTWVLSLLCAQN